jgi:tetratricopeptide (TPR) repeat protein
MEIFELIAYHAAMFYALSSVAIAWSWGGRRGISETSLMILGVAVPAAGWLFSLAPDRPEPSLLAPLCFGYLWYASSRREKRDDRFLDDEYDRELARIEERLRAAPDDGVAHLTLARMYEQKGRAAEALERYESAHAASDRMFTEMDLADARERLSRAQEAAPAPAAGKPLHPADWIAFAVGAALLFSSPVRGASVLASTAFARWLHAETRARP